MGLNTNCWFDIATGNRAERFLLYEMEAFLFSFQISGHCLSNTYLNRHIHCPSLFTTILNHCSFSGEGVLIVPLEQKIQDLDPVAMKEQCNNSK